MWVLEELCLQGFDRNYEIELVELWHPARQPPRHVQKKKANNLSVELLQSCSCIVLCGGNCHCLLQSFSTCR